MRHTDSKYDQNSPVVKAVATVVVCCLAALFLVCCAKVGLYIWNW